MSIDEEPPVNFENKLSDTRKKRQALVGLEEQQLSGLCERAKN